MIFPAQGYLYFRFSIVYRILLNIVVASPMSQVGPVWKSYNPQHLIMNLKPATTMSPVPLLVCNQNGQQKI
jgi:hypothetical protein